MGEKRSGEIGEHPDFVAPELLVTITNRAWKGDRKSFDLECTPEVRHEKG